MSDEILKEAQAKLDETAEPIPPKEPSTEPAPQPLEAAQFFDQAKANLEQKMVEILKDPPTTKEAYKEWKKKAKTVKRAKKLLRRVEWDHLAGQFTEIKRDTIGKIFLLWIGIWNAISIFLIIATRDWLMGFLGTGPLGSTVSTIGMILLNGCGSMISLLAADYKKNIEQIMGLVEGQVKAEANALMDETKNTIISDQRDLIQRYQSRHLRDTVQNLISEASSKYAHVVADQNKAIEIEEEMKRLLREKFVEIECDAADVLPGGA